MEKANVKSRKATQVGHAMKRNSLSYLRRTHTPLWLQRRAHIVLGEHNISWDLADSVGAVADSLVL